MIKMKVGGMILTGLAAFLVADKALHSANRAVESMCDAVKWSGYYKCWRNGKAGGEPIAPGYSRTTRPDKADYEVVDDPSGADHSNDNQPKEPKEQNSSDSVKAVCEAVKAVADHVIDSLTKRSDELTGASEGQTEASTEDILAQSVEEAREAGVPEEKILHNVEEIDEFFNNTKEQDQDETVD